jgi:hypothetical protein
MMHGFLQAVQTVLKHIVNAGMSVVYAGYGDVSWNNPSMATPNLEKMAR